MKIALVAGTRPEVIKLAPVYAELKRRKMNPFWVFTGQQKDLGPDAFVPFRMHPEVVIDLDRKGGSLTELMAALAEALDDTFRTLEPDMVIVQGDTLSAAVAAQQAFLAGIDTAHVEAGLRSWDVFSPYPEEACRVWIDAVADFKFAPTKGAAATLSGNVWVTGNTVVDAVNMVKHESKRKGSYAVVTMHRRENSNDVFKVIEAVKRLAKTRVFDYIVWPVHPNPSFREVVPPRLRGITNVEITEPLRYDDMVNLVSGAKMLLTDSGGLQEEALALNVPCLVMRKETERPEGILVGGARLVGCDETKLVSWATWLMENPDDWQAMADAPNPYGDGKAAQRIATVIEGRLKNRKVRPESVTWVEPPLPSAGVT